MNDRIDNYVRIAPSKVSLSLRSVFQPMSTEEFVKS